MKINIKATNIELTPAITNYVHDKLRTLEKVIRDPEKAFAHVEVAKTTEHHRTGDDLFKAEIQITDGGKVFRTVEMEGDVLAALDKAKDEMFRDIRSTSERKRNLFIRGARSLKKRIKGFKPW